VGQCLAPEELRRIAESQEAPLKRGLGSYSIQWSPEVDKVKKGTKEGGGTWGRQQVRDCVGVSEKENEKTPNAPENTKTPGDPVYFPMVKGRGGSKGKGRGCGEPLRRQANLLDLKVKREVSPEPKGCESRGRAKMELKVKRIVLNRRRGGGSSKREPGRDINTGKFSPERPTWV